MRKGWLLYHPLCDSIASFKGVLTVMGTGKASGPVMHPGTCIRSGTPPALVTEMVTVRVAGIAYPLARATAIPNRSDTGSASATV